MTEVSFPKSDNGISKYGSDNALRFLNIAILLIVLVIGYKNYKNRGFWIGVGAMFLLGLAIYSPSDKSLVAE